MVEGEGGVEVTTCTLDRVILCQGVETRAGLLTWVRHSEVILNWRILACVGAEPGALVGWDLGLGGLDKFHHFLCLIYLIQIPPHPPSSLEGRLRRGEDMELCSNVT